MCMYIYICIYIYICKYVYIYICKYVYIYIYVNMYIYICIYYRYIATNMLLGLSLNSGCLKNFSVNVTSRWKQSPQGLICKYPCVCILYIYMYILYIHMYVFYKIYVYHIYILYIYHIYISYISYIYIYIDIYHIYHIYIYTDDWSNIVKFSSSLQMDHPMTHPGATMIRPLAPGGKQPAGRAPRGWLKGRNL